MIDSSGHYTGPEDKGNPLDAFSRDAEPVEDNSGEAEESLAEMLRRNFGDALKPQVDKENFFAELLDELRANGALVNSHRRKKLDVPKWMGKFYKILKYIKNHPQSTAIYAVCHIWDEPVIDVLHGNMNQSEFAASIGLDKAAVNNAIKDAQKEFKTRPRRDMRKDEACGNMSTANLAKLAKQNPQ